MDKELYFLTLNWDTTEHLQAMVESIENQVGGALNWLILDNGSERQQWRKLYSWAYGRSGRVVVSRLSDVRHIAGIASATTPRPRTVIVRRTENLGMIVGYNTLLDLAWALAKGKHEVFLVNTDMRILGPFLDEVLQWADARPEVGVVGLEHSRGEVCAAAIFLDTAGNWYTQGGQTKRAEPVEGESVGLGFCLVRWPVLDAGIRFNPEYEFYYKQDDDFTFQIRLKLGLQIWAYPIACAHLGRASIRAHNYQVGPAKNQVQFEEMKTRNRTRFSSDWADFLRGRRGNMGAERAHLDTMRRAMADARRADEAIPDSGA